MRSRVLIALVAVVAVACTSQESFTPNEPVTQPPTPTWTPPLRPYIGTPHNYGEGKAMAVALQLSDLPAGFTDAGWERYGPGGSVYAFDYYCRFFESGSPRLFVAASVAEFTTAEEASTSLRSLIAEWGRSTWPMDASEVVGDETRVLIRNYGDGVLVWFRLANFTAHIDVLDSNTIVETTNESKLAIAFDLARKQAARIRAAVP